MEDAAKQVKADGSLNMRLRDQDQHETCSDVQQTSLVKSQHTEFRQVSSRTENTFSISTNVITQERSTWLDTEKTNPDSWNDARYASALHSDVTQIALFNTGAVDSQSPQGSADRAEHFPDSLVDTAISANFRQIGLSAEASTRNVPDGIYPESDESTLETSHQATHLQSHNVHNVHARNLSSRSQELETDQSFTNYNMRSRHMSALSHHRDTTEQSFLVNAEHSQSNLTTCSGHSQFSSSSSSSVSQNASVQELISSHPTEVLFLDDGTTSPPNTDTSNQSQFPIAGDDSHTLELLDDLQQDWVNIGSDFPGVNTAKSSHITDPLDFNADNTTRRENDSLQTNSESFKRISKLVHGEFSNLSPTSSVKKRSHIMNKDNVATSSPSHQETRPRPLYTKRDLFVPSVHTQDPIAHGALPDTAPERATAVTEENSPSSFGASKDDAHQYIKGSRPSSSTLSARLQDDFRSHVSLDSPPDLDFSYPIGQSPLRSMPSFEDLSQTPHKTFPTIVHSTPVDRRAVKGDFTEEETQETSSFREVQKQVNTVGVDSEKYTEAGCLSNDSHPRKNDDNAENQSRPISNPGDSAEAASPKMADEDIAKLFDEHVLHREDDYDRDDSDDEYIERFIEETFVIQNNDIKQISYLEDSVYIRDEDEDSAASEDGAKEEEEMVVDDEIHKGDDDHDGHKGTHTEFVYNVCDQILTQLGEEDNIHHIVNSPLIAIEEEDSPQVSRPLTPTNDSESQPTSQPSSEDTLDERCAQGPSIASIQEPESLHLDTLIFTKTLTDIREDDEDEIENPGNDTSVDSGEPNDDEDDNANVVAPSDDRDTDMTDPVDYENSEFENLPSCERSEHFLDISDLRDCFRISMVQHDTMHGLTIDDNYDKHPNTNNATQTSSPGPANVFEVDDVNVSNDDDQSRVETDIPPIISENKPVATETNANVSDLHDVAIATSLPNSPTNALNEPVASMTLPAAEDDPNSSTDNETDEHVDSEIGQEEPEIMDSDGEDCPEPENNKSLFGTDDNVQSEDILDIVETPDNNNITVGKYSGDTILNEDKGQKGAVCNPPDQPRESSVGIDRSESFAFGQEKNSFIFHRSPQCVSTSEPNTCPDTVVVKPVRFDDETTSTSEHTVHFTTTDSNVCSLDDEKDDFPAISTTGKKESPRQGGKAIGDTDSRDIEHRPPFDTSPSDTVSRGEDRPDKKYPGKPADLDNNEPQTDVSTDKKKKKKRGKKKHNKEPNAAMPLDAPDLNEGSSGIGCPQTESKVENIPVSVESCIDNSDSRMPSECLSLQSETLNMHESLPSETEEKETKLDGNIKSGIELEDAPPVKGKKKKDRKKKKTNKQHTDHPDGGPISGGSDGKDGTTETGSTVSVVTEGKDSCVSPCETDVMVDVKTNSTDVVSQIAEESGLVQPWQDSTIGGEYLIDGAEGHTGSAENEDIIKVVVGNTDNNNIATDKLEDVFGLQGEAKFTIKPNEESILNEDHRQRDSTSTTDQQNETPKEIDRSERVLDDDKSDGLVSLRPREPTMAARPIDDPGNVLIKPEPSDDETPQNSIHTIHFTVADSNVSSLDDEHGNLPADPTLKEESETKEYGDTIGVEIDRSQSFLDDYQEHPVVFLKPHAPTTTTRPIDDPGGALIKTELSGDETTQTSCHTIHFTVTDSHTATSDDKQINLSGSPALKYELPTKKENDTDKDSSPTVSAAGDKSHYSEHTLHFTISDSTTGSLDDGQKDIPGRKEASMLKTTSKEEPTTLKDFATETPPFGFGGDKPTGKKKKTTKEKRRKNRGHKSTDRIDITTETTTCTGTVNHDDGAGGRTSTDHWTEGLVDIGVSTNRLAFIDRREQTLVPPAGSEVGIELSPTVPFEAIPEGSPVVNDPRTTGTGSSTVTASFGSHQDEDEDIGGCILVTGGDTTRHRLDLTDEGLTVEKESSSTVFFRGGTHIDDDGGASKSFSSFASAGETLLVSPGLWVHEAKTDEAIITKNVELTSTVTWSQAPPGLLYRVLRAALLILLLWLLLFLLLLLLIPVCEEDYCLLANNLRHSMTPMLTYTSGAPPT